MRTALHCVSQSPHAGSALAECAAVIREGSAILLLQDGVYAAAAGSRCRSQLDALPPGVRVHALQADLQARGLAELHPRVQVVDDAGFVALAVAHATSVAWY